MTDANRSVRAAEDDVDGQRRKRPRKGTTSCWECKRRKIRCLRDPENSAVCVGCRNRATACVSQEYPPDHIPSGGTQLGERLNRVENLLQSLLQKVSAQSSESPLLENPESLDGQEDFNESISHHTPIFSLFDNAIIDTSDAANKSRSSEGLTPGRTQFISSSLSPKEQRLRQTLAALLPSQHDADLIGEATNAWALEESLCVRMAVNNPIEKSELFIHYDLAAVSKEHPISIARTLLHIAVWMQQLPPEFDTTQLRMGSNIDAVIEKYTSNVSDLVTSNDEYMGTLGGLDLLMLQGLFQINTGNLRRAWLTFRRALSIAELMSFHRPRSSKGTKGLDGPSGLAGRYMYHHMVTADRYLGVILGLPCGSDDPPFEPHETFQNPEMDTSYVFMRRVSNIAGAIIRRNQADAIQSFTATQRIVEMVDDLYLEMPSSWWEIPDLKAAGRSTEAISLFDRVIMQMYYFQLESFLHLPFMLRSERRYGFSRFSCLKASREIIFRYQALRRANNTQLCCRIVDFIALMGSIMLVLNFSCQMNDTEEAQIAKEKDRVLVKQMISSMEDLAKSSSREIVAAQSVDVLKTLLSADSGTVVGSIRLNIPHLGTIAIAQKPGSEAAVAGLEAFLQQQHVIEPSTVNSPSSAPQDEPIISFSSSQYPSIGNSEPPIQTWDWTAADSFLFDSISGSDLDGSWIS